MNRMDDIPTKIIEIFLNSPQTSTKFENDPFKLISDSNQNTHSRSLPRVGFCNTIIFVFF